MLRDIVWVGSSKDDIKTFPKAVQADIGFALHRAQEGKTHDNAKAMKGIGTGIFEIVSRHDKDTFRAVYGVKISDDIYVLHAFQKKSKTGIKTPKFEIDLIKKRLAVAKAHAKSIK